MVCHKNKDTPLPPPPGVEVLSVTLNPSCVIILCVTAGVLSVTQNLYGIALSENAALNLNIKQNGFVLH